jgi:hypothetical protein
MNKAIYARIEQQFKSRIEAARQQGDKLKPGSVSYHKKQAEFFTGAMAALVAVFEQSQADIEAIYTEAAGNAVEVHPDMVKRLHGKAMPPKWVFGILRGEDLLKEETESSNKTS